jgi:hypothetical protein
LAGFDGMMPRTSMMLLLMESVTTDWSPWVIAGVGAAAVMLLIVVMRPPRRGDADAVDDPADELTDAPAANPSLAQQRGVEREISQLMTELSEMTRQVGAQLDARSAKLEKLLREADDRIAKLKSMPPPSASPTPRVDGDLRPQMTVARRLDGLEPVSVATPAEETGAAAVAAGKTAGHAEIYALADAGRAAADIAAQLGRPTGEVELILALRTKD